MVDFIVDYHVPVDMVTDKRRLGLSDYALDEHEWKVLEQLRDVLAVRQLLQRCNHTAAD